MALLGFKKEFAGLVEVGMKRQTIRAERAHPVKVGERLILAEGVRTKAYRQLGETVCTETFPVAMIRTNGTFKWFINGGAVRLNDPVLVDIAQRDGFMDVTEMSNWFDRQHLARTGNDAFIGNVIRWENLLTI